MSKYIIKGGNKLYGEIETQGAKNSVLPIMSASLLTDEKVVIRGVPRLRDVESMLNIMENLGVKYLYEGHTLILDSSIFRLLAISIFSPYKRR